MDFMSNDKLNKFLSECEREIDGGVSPYHGRKLLAIIRVLAEALEDAIDTIHPEFCGSGHHHQVCEYPRNALKRVEELIDGV